MFQFSGFTLLSEYHVFNMVGCPIRKFTDQFVCANPRNLSQLITSFFASESLGIPIRPYFCLLLSFLFCIHCPKNSILCLSTFKCIVSQYVNELWPWKIPKFKFQIPIIGFWYFIFFEICPLGFGGEYRVEPMMTSCVQGRRSSQLS